ncbi:hypothetical protein H4V97_001289 [Flavobacterium sp. CG_23.5]|jgi:hypothetical protein|uniref:hypothetical protein n=1 Tax=Flavobacterium sp. CG_23.5 TaxID=2760708 RepID=UPI001AEAF64F|nr:hypothetical protein [Flavobacterium sp. CG_23.5]MBP2282971.1 hypothetical protein [Flavobacterium sp. CG_23.5]
MICFLVNRIVEIDNVTHGIAMENELVIHNFGLVYGLEKAKNLLLSIQQKNENQYLISRFGDYIGFLQYKVDLGFSLKLTDFENNFDTALDEYLSLQKKEWKQEHIIKYLEIAKEIENKSQPSKMIISNPL